MAAALFSACGSKIQQRISLPNSCILKASCQFCPTAFPIRSGNSKNGISYSTITTQVGDTQYSLSTGKLAKMADGSVVLESGGMAVLTTSVSSHVMTKGSAGFLPLNVNYRERAAAARRIPSNFLRRELQSTEKEILSSRCIDRSIRPLFPKGYSHDTQIICELLAYDGKGDPEVSSINGALTALSISDIPWHTPAGAARVCLSEGQLVVNPPGKVIKKSALNLVVTAGYDKIVMIEGFGDVVSEELICEAAELAQTAVLPFLDAVSEFQVKNGKKKRNWDPYYPTKDLYDAVHKECYNEIAQILSNASHTKSSRDSSLFQILNNLSISGSDDGSLLSQAFWDVCRDCLRDLILDKGIRCDGRGLDDLRPINCSVDLFQSLHGSALFQRGETQVFCTVTFDSPDSAAKTDLISQLLGGQKSKAFLVHYDFPPYATNEVKPSMLPNRRDVGHGVLGERGLRTVLPPDFPFTIRLTSQVLDSNGSSSMATVCGGSLALYDAGVPISQPVAGVACGLASRCTPEGQIIKHAVLTDLLGIEDATGNMDFKVAGTRSGVTSLQCDIKGLNGLPLSIIEEALSKSKNARLRVLDKMDSVQDSPRHNIRDNCPAYETILIPSRKRLNIVGAGGHRVKALIEETGADVQTVDDECMSIYAPSRDIMDDVKERLEAMMEDGIELTFGEIYKAKIVEVRNYGVMVELIVGNEYRKPAKALLHLSQMDHKPVRHPSELGLKEGDVVDVKYFGEDPVTNTPRLSSKVLKPLPTVSTPSDPPTVSKRKKSNTGNKVEGFKIIR